MVRNWNRVHPCNHVGERLEHSGGVLGGKAGEDQVERLAVGEAVLDEGGDLPRRGGIVAAIEPDLAVTDQRTRRETLQPGGPIGPAHRGAERSVGNAQPVLMPQHRDG